MLPFRLPPPLAPFIHCTRIHKSTPIDSPSINNVIVSLTGSKFDGAQSYIRWAVAHNFGVIDVNVPEIITVPDPSGGSIDIEYASTETDAARKEGEKLALYLWENYIEPYEFPGGIFIIGAGHAFHAVAKLASESGKRFNFTLFHSYTAFPIPPGSIPYFHLCLLL